MNEKKLLQPLMETEGPRSSGDHSGTLLNQLILSAAMKQRSAGCVCKGQPDAWKRGGNLTVTRSGRRCVARQNDGLLKGLLGAGGALGREKLLVALSKGSPHACVDKHTRRMHLKHPDVCTPRTVTTSAQYRSDNDTGDIHLPHRWSFQALFLRYLRVVCFNLKAKIYRDKRTYSPPEKVSCGGNLTECGWLIDALIDSVLGFQPFVPADLQRRKSARWTTSQALIGIWMFWHLVGGVFFFFFPFPRRRELNLWVL